MKMLTFLLIEDHGIVREGIEQLLEKAHDLQLIGSVGTHAYPESTCELIFYDTLPFRGGNHAISQNEI